MKKFFDNNLFTYLVQFLIIALPFYVLFAVFFSTQLGLPKAWFFVKELVIVLLFFSLIYEFVKNKKFPKLDLLDYLVFSYILYGVLITFYNWLWLNSVIYGWRYDFIFLIVLLIVKHWKQFLTVKVNDLVKLFIISSNISLLFSILIKFRLWEKALLIFGFTDYISSWTYNWSIPTYHWLENSWIKRFQWIFDWPNQMAFFLILYTSILLQYVKKKFEYHIILILVFIFWLLLLTYSRSALLWVFSGVWLLFILNIKYIYKNFRKQLLAWILIFLIFCLSILVVFREKVQNIFLRTSSTTGHFDRMEIWIDRFKVKPFWSWLAESGPAFRNIYTDQQTKEAEQFYIPESWFIQQLVEWGFIYFSLFILIFIIILIDQYKNSKPLFVWIVAVLVMNVFLHIFEATYLSILLFIFVWLFYNKK